MTLVVRGLTAQIGGKPILHGLDFEAPAGWFGILGANGGGKTTLLRVLDARLPVTAGRIVWRDADLTSQPAVRAQSFGFAPPTEAFPPTLTAGELISLTQRLRGANADAPAGIRAALGVDALLDTPLGRMSAGMKQRVSLLFAFFGAPDLVLLDEPFNWLDPVAVYELKRELRLYADSGRTVVTALHDVETFATRCDGGLLLHEGRVLDRINAADMAQARANPAALEARIYERIKS
jgi:ABC-type multidrug transport system ATPase subunit